MILIAGATGNVGGAVTRILAEAGESARALVRDPGRQGLDPRITWVRADLNEPSTVAAALPGATAMFLLAGYPGLPQILDAARDTGVRRVVLLSSLSAGGGDTGNVIAKYHIESEEAIRASGLPYSFLRPPTFMTNTLQWAPTIRDGGVVRATFPDVPTAVIDPQDIAAVAVVALRDTGTDNHIRELSGPQAMTPKDRIDVLSDVLGHRIGFEGLTDEQSAKLLHEQLPAEYAEANLKFFAEGTLDESPVRPTVEQLTGRPPATFRQWAEANAGEFGGTAAADR
jgi:uncharacterized protein YbjT (DUF2867 family)